MTSGTYAARCAQRIIRHRKAGGLSQGELARRLGSTLSMIGKLERGERELSATWMERIAAALRIEPEAIGASG